MPRLEVITVRVDDLEPAEIRAIGEAENSNSYVRYRGGCYSVQGRIGHDIEPSGFRLSRVNDDDCK